MFTMINFSYFLMTILGFLGLFLIGLILLQRGRGGGLAGAFGGMGGQSAFGTKAGDVFTRITIGVAAAWILLCAGSVLALHFSANTHAPSSVFTSDKTDDASTLVKKADPKDDKPQVDVAPSDMDEKPPVQQPKKDDSEKPAVPDDKKPDDKKADDKKPEEKPAEAAPAGDKPKDEAKAKEDAKPAEDAKPKEAGEGDKKPVDPKPADPKPEPKDK